MEKGITNRLLADRLGFPYSSVRRWSKEFLGADSKARQRSGYRRLMSSDEAFKIFLLGHLIQNLGFAVDDAKQIVKDLEPWLKRKGIFPESNYAEIEPNCKADEKVKLYKIRIQRSTSGFSYIAIGEVGFEEITEDNITIHRESYTTEVIKPGGATFGYPSIFEPEILLSIFLQEMLGAEKGLRTWFRGRPGRSRYFPDWEERVRPLTKEDVEKQEALGREIAEIANNIEE